MSLPIRFVTICFGILWVNLVVAGCSNDEYPEGRWYSTSEGGHGMTREEAIESARQVDWPRTPDHPPKIYLTNRDRSKKIPATAIQFDWAVMGGEVFEDVRWPSPIRDRDATVLAIEFEEPPGDSLVYVYHRVEEHGRPLLPEELSEDDWYVIDCPSKRACYEVIDGVAYWDVLPVDSAPVEYINVFVSWTKFPPDFEEYNQVYGSWRFHFVNERRRRRWGIGC